LQHTLLLTSNGEVLAFGDNTDGQCGQGEMKSKTGKTFSLFFSRVVDPDSVTLWIRDPYWESGSRGKKIRKFQWKNALYSYFLKTFYHYKGIK
jgi:alpha-tubulin suppressor-like RCC1 family protein